MLQYILRLLPDVFFHCYLTGLLGKAAAGGVVETMDDEQSPLDLDSEASASIY